jgi:cysteine synthase A
MDGIVAVSTDRALEVARRLASEEGLLCGPSSGMNVAAVHTLVAKHPELRRIVTVVPDTGQRYLSGELLGERTDVEEPDREHVIDPEILAELAKHRDRLEFIG